MQKTIITIEKDSFEQDGQPMVRRTIKQDGVILYDDTIKPLEFELTQRKLDIFERWICCLKNPARFRVGYYPAAYKQLEKYYEWLKKAENDETFSCGFDENFNFCEYYGKRKKIINRF